MEQGFHVAVMDTRDLGLSTHLHHLDNLPRRERPGYTLADMTDDVIAVLDALGWRSAHLVGASLGGMIAQATAVRHPTRIRSLTSMLANAGGPFRLSRPKILGMIRMILAMRGTSADRDVEGEKWVRLFRAVGSPAYPILVDHWREAGRLSFDRGVNPKGAMRNTAAMLAAGDRRPELAKITCPTLVIHGKRDRLAQWRGGKVVADTVPGAKFVLYPEMGHELAGPLWPAIIGEIEALVARTVNA